ncbi:MAG: winged helix-turn-helix domain-containing protein [Lachnospiraceae bacterium]
MSVINLMLLGFLMRKLTPAPIRVSVTRYNQEENYTAIKNGADIYRVRYDTAENRVERFSSLIKFYIEYYEGQQRPMTVLTYDAIQIFPHTRKVYVQGVETRLAQKEFDILQYLVMNKGIVLSYEQILRRVWRDEYAINDKGLLWNQVSRLRGKMQISPDLPDFIITERNYGYSFDPRQKAV